MYQKLSGYTTYESKLIPMHDRLSKLISMHDSDRWISPEPNSLVINLINSYVILLTNREGVGGVSLVNVLSYLCNK